MSTTYIPVTGKYVYRGSAASEPAAFEQVKGQRYWGWTAAMIDALAYLLTRKEGHCKRAWEAEQI